MADQGTRLETEDEVRRALQMFRPRAGEGSPTSSATAAGDDSPRLFRPTLRPPTPILTVCDDGAEDGESVRIRKERFVIGRTEGDLIIPNDTQISSRHAELRQSFVKEKYRWSLIDLQSTNGTYVRIGHAVLEHGQEFLIGYARFRFEKQLAVDSAALKSTKTPEQGTRLWQSPASGNQLAAIVDSTSADHEVRFCLDRPNAWLGKDAAFCQIVLANDPLISARHARIRRHDDGRWILESNKSVNGIWLRVEQISFQGTCRFMLGEQKFTIRTPE